MKITIFCKKHPLRRTFSVLLVCGLGIAASPACAQQYGNDINPNVTQPLTASPDNPNCVNGQANCTPNGASGNIAPSGFAPSSGAMGTYNAPSGFAPAQGNIITTPNGSAPGVASGISGNAPLGGAPTGAATGAVAGAAKR